MGTWLDPACTFFSGRGNNCHTIWIDVNTLPSGANQATALLAFLPSPYLRELLLPLYHHRIWLEILNFNLILMHEVGTKSSLGPLGVFTPLMKLLWGCHFSSWYSHVADLHCSTLLPRTQTLLCSYKTTQKWTESSVQPKSVGDWPLTL